MPSASNTFHTSTRSSRSKKLTEPLWGTTNPLTAVGSATDRPYEAPPRAEWCSENGSRLDKYDAEVA